MKKVTVKKKEKEIVSVSATVEPIDYDKLAEAIVQATTKESKKYSISREWMKFIIQPVFWGIAIVAGILSIAAFVYGVAILSQTIGAESFAEFDWLKLFTGACTLIIGFFLITVCLTTIFTAKDMDKEDDRQYVAAMFSNVVALTALIVSLIALVKG